MWTGETTAIPAGVTALAEQRGLGTVVDLRNNPHTVTVVLRSLVTAVTGFCVSFGLFALAGGHLRPLAPAGMLALAVGIGGLGRAIVAGLRGDQAVYLYEHGIVQVRNDHPRAARWSEIERLEVSLVRAGHPMAGTTTAYLLLLSGRAPMRMRPVLRGQPGGIRQDPFGAAMTRMVADAGRPVIEKAAGPRRRSPGAPSTVAGHFGCSPCIWR